MRGAGLAQHAELHQRELDVQPRIHTRAVPGLAGRRNRQSIVEELQRAFFRLFLIFLFKGLRELQKRIHRPALAHDQIPEMRTQGCYEMQGIEALGQNFIEREHRRSIIPGKEILHEREGIFIIKDIQVLKNILIFNLSATEGHRLVENRQRVAHRSVSLHRDDMQRLIINADALFPGNIPQLLHDIVHRDTVEIISLATGKDGRENFVLLSRGEDENRVLRRFLEGFQESVEGRLRKHVDLVDDVDAVFADLRRDTDLVHEGLDVLDAVVGSCIQLSDAVGTAFREGLA